MAYVYRLTTTAKRQVALDSHFQCRNPACGYSSPVRCWGMATASEETDQSRSPIRSIQAGLKAKAKHRAETMAWESARRLMAMVACPRCTSQPPAGVQFAAGVR